MPGLSIDSRTLDKGDAFFAITGDNRDGHDFVEAALKAGAGLAVVARDQRDRFAADAPLLIVDDVLERFARPRRAARARSHAKVIAVTGSVGKTSTKEALRLALSADGETHASAASYNNHWGVPLSLARLPGERQIRRVRDRHEPRRRDHAAYQIGAPACGDRHGDRAGASGIFRLAEEDRRRQGGNFSWPRIGRRCRAQSRQSPIHATRQGCGRGGSPRASCRSAASRKADARLVRHSLQAENSTVEARILGQPVTYKLGAPGKHLVLNSLAVLATAALVGSDLALAALALSNLKPAAGRGVRASLRVPGGSALLIDESYNANPASMAAAIALLGQAPVGGQGRRIAVLGDMLELGGQGPALHRALAEPIEAAGIDLVFCSGPLMRALWEALPTGTPGRLCRDRGGAGAGRPRRHPRRRRGDGEGFAWLENGADRQGAGTAIRQTGRARSGAAQDA